MKVRKAFRLNEEDIRLLKAVKEKLGYETDVEAIRYLLRGIQKPANVEIYQASIDKPLEKALKRTGILKVEKGNGTFDFCPKHKIFNKSCGGPH